MLPGAIKENLLILTKSEKVKLPTISPSAWSILKTSKYFDVPVSMFMNARNLKKTKGILTELISWVNLSQMN